MAGARSRRAKQFNVSRTGHLQLHVPKRTGGSENWGVQAAVVEAKLAGTSEATEFESNFVACGGCVIDKQGAVRGEYSSVALDNEQ